MEIKIFRSNKGDCLLLSNDFPTQRNRHILVDGGLVTSFRNYVTPELHNILQADEQIDLLCVSHIDDDHIAGILELLEQVVDWRVYRFFQGAPDHPNPQPKGAEPPPIGEIWHNAFSDLVGENIGPIVDALAHSSYVLGGSTDSRHLQLAEYAASVKQAIELSHRISADQLGIPLNPQHEGKMVMYRPRQEPIKIGRFKLTLLGPFEEDLDELRKEWNDWLENNQAVLESINQESRAIEERLQLPTLSSGGELGDRSKVTIPNLASIMFLLEEWNTKILMTGDGHGKDILKGLEQNGRLNDGRLHVDVLKVQHHGSEFNLDATFCQKITADHYIFCGNGAHENPDIKVLDAIWASRMGPPESLSKNEETDHPFKFWFNSSSAITSSSRKVHMELVEAWAEEKKRAHDEQFDYVFLKEGERFLSLKL